MAARVLLSNIQKREPNATHVWLRYTCTFISLLASFIIQEIRSMGKMDCEWGILIHICREELEEEISQRREDIAFLQECSEGESLSPTPLPSIRELREVGTQLEREVMKGMSRGTSSPPAKLLPISPPGKWCVCMFLSGMSNIGILSSQNVLSQHWCIRKRHLNSVLSWNSKFHCTYTQIIYLHHVLLFHTVPAGLTGQLPEGPRGHTPFPQLHTQL